MIQTSLINDNQFLRARQLGLPVTIVDARTFVMPSATRPEITGHHRVTFDSADAPVLYECSCESGVRGKACWAAARALDVLMLLAANDIRIAPPASPAVITRAPANTPPSASFSGVFEHRRTPPVVVPDAHPAAVLTTHGGKAVEKIHGYMI